MEPRSAPDASLTSGRKQVPHAMYYIIGFVILCLIAWGIWLAVTVSVRCCI